MFMVTIIVVTLVLLGEALVLVIPLVCMVLDIVLIGL